MAEQSKRIRIGITGLAFVFLLVLVGAAITRWGADDGPANGSLTGNLLDDEPNEPLAEIGAAPGPSSASTNDSHNKQ